jgi:acyl carrier protein
VTSQTIEEQVREFVWRQFPLARKKGLKPDEKWLESGVLDSLGILDLVHFLENEMLVQIADEELTPDNFESLERVAQFVRSKLNGGTQKAENTAPTTEHASMSGDERAYRRVE